MKDVMIRWFSFISITAETVDCVMFEFMIRKMAIYELKFCLELDVFCNTAIADINVSNTTSRDFNVRIKINCTR